MIASELEEETEDDNHSSSPKYFLVKGLLLNTF